MRRFTFRLIVALHTFLLGVMITPTVKVNRHQISETPSIEQSEQRQTNIQRLPVSQEFAYSLMDVAILDNGEIWGVGLDSNDSRIMWHSKDKGETWETVIAPTGGWVLCSIQFIDNQHGWATGSGNVLIRTSDGGKSWERFKLPVYMSDVKVGFINSQIGFVAGSIGYMDRRTGKTVQGIEVLKTINGGKNWLPCYQDNESNDVWNIAALSEKIIVMSLDGQSLLRTEDGGQSWKIVATHKRAGFQHVVFNLDGTGWAVGENTFYFSTDQGRTWQTPDHLPPTTLTHDWWSIDFATTKIGMAVSEDRAIIITYDGGKTWQEMKTKFQQVNTIKANFFDERLRKVRLHPNTGIIFGSQMLYRIESFE